MIRKPVLPPVFEIPQNGGFVGDYRNRAYMPNRMPVRMPGQSIDAPNFAPNSPGSEQPQNGPSNDRQKWWEPENYQFNSLSFHGDIISQFPSAQLVASKTHEIDIAIFSISLSSSLLNQGRTPCGIALAIGGGTTLNLNGGNGILIVHQILNVLLLIPNEVATVVSKHDTLYFENHPLKVKSNQNIGLFAFGDETEGVPRNLLSSTCSYNWVPL